MKGTVMDRLAVKAAIVAAAAAVWSAVVVPLASAEHIYMTVEGQRSGKFKGEARDPKKGGMIPVAGVSHSVVSPRDIQSGLPTGQRMHKPLVVTKALGVSSPQFFASLSTNENLKTVELQFMGKGPRGEDVPYYVIRLTNANIASYDLKTSDIPRQGALTTLLDFEEIAFTYQTIEVRNLQGNTGAIDNWETRQ